MLLTEKDDNSTVTARVGDAIEVALAENPTTGYRWEITDFDASIVGTEQNDFSGSAGAAGAGGTRHIAFRARSPGAVRIQLLLRRSWEPPAAATTRWSVAIEVGNGQAASG